MIDTQAIRNKILDLAIRGKLVPQDPNDEPASVLLERIRAERERLIAEGKIKKGKTPSRIFRGADNTHYEIVGNNPPVSIEDEIPFEIPESWSWVRLGQISTYAETKKKVNPKDVPPVTWGLDLEDIEKGGRIVVKRSVADRKAIGEKVIFYKGDILYSKLRPYLLKVLVAPDDGICTSEIVPFKVFDGIDSHFITFFLKSPSVDSFVNFSTLGIKMPRVSSETMISMFVPIPPLTEQQRIAAKIEQAFSILAAIEKLQAQYADNLASLKKSILQEAVMGKLVPQDPNDEPASVLIERIHAEKERLIAEGKIKRDENESRIYKRGNSYYENQRGNERCIDEELPFEIPDSWCWTKIKSIGFTQTGNTPPKNHLEYFGNDIPFIGPGDIQNGEINYNNQGLSSIGLKHGRIATEGAILQVCIGGSIGKAAINSTDVSFNQQINAISPIICNKDFIFNILISPFLLDTIQKKAGGAATPIINKGLWDNLLIPMAPVEEQGRIVSVLKKVFTLCDIT